MLKKKHTTTKRKRKRERKERRKGEKRAFSYSARLLFERNAMTLLILGVLLLLLGMYIERPYRSLRFYPRPKSCFVVILGLTGFAFILIFIIKRVTWWL